jgi:hypothetical protein
MSERETLKTAALDNELVKRGRYDDRHRELLSHSYDLERENARLKSAHDAELKNVYALAQRLQARVTELEAKLALEQEARGMAVAETILQMDRAERAEAKLALYEARIKAIESEEDIDNNGQANWAMRAVQILREDR